LNHLKEIREILISKGVDINEFSIFLIRKIYRSIDKKR